MLVRQQDNYSAARLSASRLIRRFAISQPEEIMVEDLAMASGVLVVEGTLHGSEARLVRKQDKGIIRVKSGAPESGRRRFSVAHELGHWFLHGDVSQFHVCTEGDLRNYIGSNQEAEANTFASELLMPTPLFKPACWGIEPGIASIKELADKFGTSLTSTAVRFVEENKENCIVVFSENSQVSWWRAKEGMSDLWIEPRQKIHSDSAAWECFHDGVAVTTMQRVPANSWFKSLRYGKRMEIYEQSMKLGKLPLVLSLLWVIEE
jgi:Zn-dependent peptidase ImmA (M78 family)